MCDQWLLVMLMGCRIRLRNVAGAYFMCSSTSASFAVTTTSLRSSTISFLPVSATSRASREEENLVFFALGAICLWTSSNPREG